MTNNAFEQTIRKSQALSPWGIGAIVPFPKNRSMMIAGLDMWDYGSNVDEYLVKDERLARHIGVEQLREPPVKTRDGGDTGLSLPAVLFPLWHYCPRCGKMVLLNMGSNDQFCSGTEAKPHRKERMIPERFVAICPHGHIQDFPIMEWVHDGKTPIDSSRHQITRVVRGSNTTLAAISYKCSCGAHKSMQSATHDGALAEIGVYCTGNRPWLGINHEDCGEELRVVQAGGSNVWFPIIRSSIWIPPLGGNADLQGKLEDWRSIIESSMDQVTGKIDPPLAGALSNKLNVSTTSLEHEWELLIERDKASSADDSTSESDYRFAEYEALTSESGNDNSSFSCRRLPIEAYSHDLSTYFEEITLVKKLQETRAFVGFSRVEPRESQNVTDSIKQLSSAGSSWVPAIKVFGEGIFLQLKASRVAEWRNRESVLKRAYKLTKAYNATAATWGRETVEVRPEYVLIHTFAHLLINRLSFDCGYGSSSLRERLFCDLSSLGEDSHKMLGVLIYTASGDSEGSMGGLVRMGEPGRLEGVVWRALEDALWCSSDPVCSQSEGQGPDSCNLAACHNCALLPETCCENGNRLLDRLMVVGGANQDSGYFAIA